MIKQLPIKTEYLLFIATVGLCLIGYKLAFKKTIEAWQANNQLKVQLVNATDLSYQPDYLSRKNINLSKVIGLYKADTIAFRNNSINTISIITQKENVKLSEVPVQDPFLHTDKFIIQKLNFEGDFFALTKAINTLQVTANIGILRSVSYKLSKEQAGNSKKLIAEVYLEIVK